MTLKQLLLCTTKVRYLAPIPAMVLSGCVNPQECAPPANCTPSQQEQVTAQAAALQLALTVADAEVSKFDDNPKNSAASKQKLNVLVAAAKAAITAYSNSTGGANAAEFAAATAAMTALTQFIIAPPANPPQI